MVVLLKRVFSIPGDTGCRVISVGNITAGGTGKTSLVMYILEKLSTCNLKKGIAFSGGNKYTDEMEMIKRNFPDVKIFRKKEIKRFIKKGEKVGLDVLLIDDGFHCHWIKKDVDILLIDAFSPFDNGFPIPSGLLREPKFFIKKADVLVISHPFMEKEEKLKNLIQYLSKFEKPIFIMDYRIARVIGKDRVISPEEVKGKKIMAFCGIGNPFNFFCLLNSLSPEKLVPLVFPDHFRYREKDINEICYLFLRSNCEMIITTEKDFVKIRKYEVEIPLYYIENEVVIEKIKGADFDTILKKR